jgi:hypothetical protein
MGLYAEIDHASFDDLKAWWQSGSPDWAGADENEMVMQEIAFALCGYGRDGIELVWSDVRSTIREKRRAALSSLAWPDVAPPGLLDDLSAAFLDDDRLLKTDALWGFIHLRAYPLHRVDVEAIVHGSDERLSALAMVYLSYAFPDERIAILRQALHSPNPRHREYACDVAGDEGLTELHDEIAGLCDDPDIDVRRAAHSNLPLAEGE